MAAAAAAAYAEIGLVRRRLMDGNGIVVSRK
jgi:hypothetical protein